MNNLQKDNLTGTNNGPLLANVPLKYLTASSIIGDKVRNKQDEHMGEIKDIMIDLTTGSIEYMVIEFGGFLGIGIKYFAIPYRLFQIDPDKKIFVLNQPKETLEKAPGFSTFHWPETNIHLEEIHSYWSFM